MITIFKMEDPPPTPLGFTIISPFYEFGPDGANFEPPQTLTFTYHPGLLPEGVSPESLVIGMWDEATGEWTILDSTVDPDTNTITTQITNFSVFAILASTTPAAFTVTDLAIVPSEAVIGGGVTITVLVTNGGDFSGSYEVTLKVDDVVVATEEVTLPGYASQEVTFITAKDVAGIYTVDVNGRAGTFEVRAVSPPPAPPAPTPPAPTPPAPVPPPATLFNWWFIGGILGGCIIIGLLIWLLVSRQRAG